AQRVWHETGVRAKDRPLIGRGQVVAATAPPAEQELRQRLAARLERRHAELFERTLQLLTGLPELGVLLKSEQELPNLMQQIFGKNINLFKDGGTGNSWADIEITLTKTLAEFTQATNITYQGCLFVHDALQGLRLIDVCREVFDVVLMNPPFGALAMNTRDQLTIAYPKSKSDLMTIFIERGLSLLRAGGRLG